MNAATQIIDWSLNRAIPQMKSEMREFNERSRQTDDRNDFLAGMDELEKSADAAIGEPPSDPAKAAEYYLKAMQTFRSLFGEVGRNMSPEARMKWMEGEGYFTGRLKQKLWENQHIRAVMMAEDEREQAVALAEVQARVPDNNGNGRSDPATPPPIDQNAARALQRERWRAADARKRRMDAIPPMTAPAAAGVIGGPQPGDIVPQPPGGDSPGGGVDLPAATPAAVAAMLRENPATAPGYAAPITDDGAEARARRMDAIPPMVAAEILAQGGEPLVNPGQHGAPEFDYEAAKRLYPYAYSGRGDNIPNATGRGSALTRGGAELERIGRQDLGHGLPVNIVDGATTSVRLTDPTLNRRGGVRGRPQKSAINGVQVDSPHAAAVLAQQQNAQEVANRIDRTEAERKAASRLLQDDKKRMSPAFRALLGLHYADSGEFDKLAAMHQPQKKKYNFTALGGGAFARHSDDGSFDILGGAENNKPKWKHVTHGNTTFLYDETGTHAPRMLAGSADGWKPGKVRGYDVGVRGEGRNRMLLIPSIDGKKPPVEIREEELTHLDDKYDKFWEGKSATSFLNAEAGAGVLTSIYGNDKNIPSHLRTYFKSSIANLTTISRGSNSGFFNLGLYRDYEDPNLGLPHEIGRWIYLNTTGQNTELQTKNATAAFLLSTHQAAKIAWGGGGARLYDQMRRYNLPMPANLQLLRAFTDPKMISGVINGAEFAALPQGDGGFDKKNLPQFIGSGNLATNAISGNASNAPGVLDASQVIGL